MSYVASTKQIVGGSYHHDKPDEYAEAVPTTYLHLRHKYGIAPDTWEVLLESDQIDASNPNHPIVKNRPVTNFNRQYFKFMRHGAVRIDAKSKAGFLDPTAFINPDGHYVVVINAPRQSQFSILGLPPGQYGIKYTTDSEYNVDLPPVSAVNGTSLAATIPGAGVITVCGTHK
jgi:glycosyl hydrolase family 30